MSEANRAQTDAVETPTDESVWSLAAFWLVAFAAAGLFAAVLIAPKWEKKLALRLRAVARAGQCTKLDDANARLRRVIDACKHDPDFTAEVARFEVDYSESGEERVPAPVLDRQRSKPIATDVEPTPVLTPFLRAFAHDHIIRQASLVTAAVFMVVALAFFNPHKTAAKS